jgi:hypothetical protein
MKLKSSIGEIWEIYGRKNQEWAGNSRRTLVPTLTVESIFMTI